MKEKTLHCVSFSFQYIKEKGWNRINVKRKLKFQLDRQSLETVYLTFIRPLLEYADVVCKLCSSCGRFVLFFFFCYERDFMKSLSCENQANIID